MRILIINNPVAGIQKKKPVKELLMAELERRGIAYRWFDTLPQKQQPLSNWFSGKSYDRVIAIGGDGTVHEVAAFLLQHNINVPLGIIGQGTFNFLALALNIPVRNPMAALEFALEQPPRAIDVLLVNKKHYALISAAKGMGSMVLKRATRQLKRKYGFFAYVITFFSSLLHYPKKRYDITVDGARHTVYAKALHIMNCLSIKGLSPAPQVDPADGMANLIVLNPKSVREYAAALWRTIRLKPTRHTPAYQMYSGKVIDVKTKRSRVVQMDGELIRSTHLHVEVMPRALRVISKS